MYYRTNGTVAMYYRTNGTVYCAATISESPSNGMTIKTVDSVSEVAAFVVVGVVGVGVVGQLSPHTAAQEGQTIEPL